MRKVDGVLLPWDRTTWLHQWWEVDRTLQGNNDESGEVTKTKLLASLSKECHFKDAGFSFHLNMIGIQMNSKMPFQGCRVPNLPWHLRGKASVPQHEEQVGFSLKVSQRFLESFLKVSWKFLKCCLKVSWKYLESFLNVAWKFLGKFIFFRTNWILYTPTCCTAEESKICKYEYKMSSCWKSHTMYGKYVSSKTGDCCYKNYGDFFQTRCRLFWHRWIRGLTSHLL